MTRSSEDPTIVPCYLEENLMFLQFSHCTSDDIKKVILDSPVKSCSLDCIRTKILKKYF